MKIVLIEMSNSKLGWNVVAMEGKEQNQIREFPDYKAERIGFSLQDAAGLL